MFATVNNYIEDFRTRGDRYTRYTRRVVCGLGLVSEEPDLELVQTFQKQVNRKANVHGCFS